MVSRTRRVTLRDAASLLGISKDAVRKRVERGTLRSDVGEDGRRYVYVDDVQDHPDQDPDHALHPGHRDALIEELRAEVAAWREEARRKDHIIAGLLERIPPAIEAPQSPESSGPARTTTEGDEGAQEGTQRPWWRRVFGG